jgi:hypothetical protein
MRALGAMLNEIPRGYQRCDGQATAWALSKGLSSEDEATAAGLAKSRVHQLIGENHLASGSGKVDALMA